MKHEPKRVPMVRVYEESDDSWFLDRGEARDCGYVTKPAGEIALAELIEWDSTEAENANHHDQTETAKRLAALITKHAGKAAAHAVLLDIAEIYGGCAFL